MKTITIFGADGRTGKEVIKEAQKQGYHIRACVFSKDKYDKEEQENFRIYEVNVLNKEEVSQAIEGTDAVISAVGHIKGGDPRMQTKGINNMIKAMQDHRVKRILSLTGTGARVEGDKPSIIDRLLNAVITLIDPQRVADGKEHVKALQSSNLDWTIVRVLKLTSSDREVESYDLSEHGPAELFTSRKKVAAILVDQLDEHEYHQKLPISS